MAEKIGVRELQRETSRYVARVDSGETFEITYRGRVVGMFVPGLADPWQQMIASGEILAPTEPGHVTDEGPIDLAVSAVAQLQANRGR